LKSLRDAAPSALAPRKSEPASTRRQSKNPQSVDDEAKELAVAQRGGPEVAMARVATMSTAPRLHAPRGSAVAARRAPATARAAAASRLGGHSSRFQFAGETNNRVSAHPLRRPPSRGASRLAVTTRAAKDSGGDSGGGMGKFLGGFLLGGAIFGVAGVLFAPQLSKTFLKGKDAAGRFLYDDYESDEDADAALERTRNDLNEKIAQLNAAIDTFAGEADKGLRDGDDDGGDDEGVENENENDEKAEATAGKISGE
jgi:gas vesicle protein